jgi:hypothetical protein
VLLRERAGGSEQPLLFETGSESRWRGIAERWGAELLPPNHAKTHYPALLARA